MKKILSKLCLVGILALSGTSLNALETNEKGFQIPDKTNAALIEGGRGLIDDVNSFEFKIYKLSNGDGLSENLINNKIWRYSITPKNNYTWRYRLYDLNCDGIFETKQYPKDFEKEILPDCYFK